MSKISRRETLARGGQALAAAAVLSTLPSTAHAQEDAGLLSRVEAFWAAHKEAEGRFEKWSDEYDRVTALPERPSFENRKAYDAFWEEHGPHALSDGANDANKRQGRAVNAVFDTPAKTYQGVLAKLKIVNVAYGAGESGGDGDLGCWQDQDAPWLANAIGDFERLSGSAS